MWRTVLLTIAIIMTAGSLHAAPLKTLEDINKSTSNFLKYISEDNNDDAFQIIKEYTVVSPSQVDDLRSKYESLSLVFEKEFGKGIGYELLEVEEKGESLVHVLGLQKLEDFAIVWTLNFYKGKNDDWKLTSFYFSDELQKLFN